jgi:xanthine dehydrogenase accessory factor
MNQPLADEIARAHRERRNCVVTTVAVATGSAPRAAGAKMIVYPGGLTSGTVGGGKFESLVIAEALAGVAREEPWLKIYPLHEGDASSFGAICGGEVTVFFEPLKAGPALHIIGAGHCAQALAKLAADCGWHVSVVDDREEWLALALAAHRRVASRSPAEYIAAHKWSDSDALVIVSRNYMIDRDALGAALRQPEMGYLGMIGSRKKVRQVFDELKGAGVDEKQFARVNAPIGLDLGSDSPPEIAVSVMAEILQVTRKASGRPLSQL